LHNSEIRLSTWRAAKIEFWTSPHTTWSVGLFIGWLVDHRALKPLSWGHGYVDAKLKIFTSHYINVAAKMQIRNAHIKNDSNSPHKQTNKRREQTN